MVFRQLAKDSIIYGGADFAGKLLAFFAFPIIAAVLSPLAFGTLELVGTTTTLLGLLMNCGLNNSVQRYYWDQDTTHSQRPIVISSALSTQIFFGLVAITLGLLLSPWMLFYIAQANLPLTWVGLVAALFLMFFSQWLQFNIDVIRLHFAPVRFLLLTFLNRVLGFIFTILVVVKWQGSVDGLLLVQAVVALVALILSLWMVRQDITTKVNFAWIRELITFGYPYVFAGLAYWLFGSMDRWMLAFLSSVEETGIYSVAFRFASIILFISTAFGQAWSPRAIKIKTDYPEKYRSIYAQVLLLLLFIMLVVGGGFSLFSGEFINLMMPPEYAFSALPLAVLCFGIILQSTQQVTAIGISLEKKSFLFAYFAWIGALANFLLNWYLIPRYGAIGAAWATTISYFILTSIYLFFTQRLHPLTIQWGKLSFLFAVYILLIFFSIYFNSSSLRWNLIVYKSIIILATASSVGWLLLPNTNLMTGD